MSSKVFFKSYVPLYRPLPSFRWCLDNAFFLNKIIVPNGGAIPCGYMVEYTLHHVAAVNGYIKIVDNATAMEAYMQGVIKLWNDRYWCWAPTATDGAEISPGCCRKADKFMGIDYYECGCKMPKALLINDMRDRARFKYFLQRRINSARKIYRFLMDKRKQDPAYWYDESNWYGFDMGLLLDYYMHMPERRRYLRFAMTHKVDVVYKMIDNTEIPPSRYATVPDFFRKAYLEVVGDRDHFDGYLYDERMDRVKAVVERHRQEALDEKQRAHTDDNSRERAEEQADSVQGSA